MAALLTPQYSAPHVTPQHVNPEQVNPEHVSPRAAGQPERHLRVVPTAGRRVDGATARVSAPVRTAVVPDDATMRRRKLIAVVVVLAMSWLLFQATTTALSSANPAAGGEDFAVVVQPGDSMWSIARAHQPVGDIRALVDVLVEVNGGTELVPGQVLRVQL